jgi:hypothetical protein
MEAGDMNHDSSFTSPTYRVPTSPPSLLETIVSGRVMLVRRRALARPMRYLHARLSRHMAWAPALARLGVNYPVIWDHAS